MMTVLSTDSSTINRDAMYWYKHHGVSGRKGLIAKLKPESVTPRTIDRVLDLLTTTELTHHDIAQRLGVQTATIHLYARTLFKRHHVHSRDELRVRVGSIMVGA